MIGKYPDLRMAKSKAESQYQEINSSDLSKLRTFFDRKTPERLQYEVRYNITNHFGNRGHEAFRSFNKKLRFNKRKKCEKK